MILLTFQNKERMKKTISKTFKVATAAFNTCGKLEKGLAIGALACTTLKFISAMVMDYSRKKY